MHDESMAADLFLLEQDPGARTRDFQRGTTTGIWCQGNFGAKQQQPVLERGSVTLGINWGSVVDCSEDMAWVIP